MTPIVSIDGKGGTGSQHVAFTLLEVLVAVVLTALLTLIMVSLTINTGNFYQRSTGELDRSSRARLVLDLLVQDLQGTIIRPTKDVWLAVDVLTDTTNSRRWEHAPGEKPAMESLQLDPKPREDTDLIDPHDYRFGQAGMWLRFFTTPQDREVFAKGREVIGDVNAVAWQLIRSRIAPHTASAESDYQLFRSVVRADRTFDAGYSIDDYHGSSQLGQPGEIQTPAPESVVCSQIVDFGVIIRQRNADGQIVEGFPNRHSSLPPLDDPHRYRVPKDGTPETIEVFVRVMSTPAMRALLQREADGLSAQEWWRLVERDSRIFSRTVSPMKAL